MKINHVLIQATDLEIMTKFLNEVTGLEEGFRPPFPFPGAWIYSEGKPLLHLVEVSANNAQQDYLGSAGSAGGNGAVDHVALEGADYKALVERLAKFRISYTERTLPLTKEHQVFIVGPDDIKLEMLFNENKGDFVQQIHL